MRSEATSPRLSLSNGNYKTPPFAALLRALVMLTGFIGVITFIGLNSRLISTPQTIAFSAAHTSEVRSPEQAARTLSDPQSGSTIDTIRASNPVWIFVPAAALTTSSTGNYLLIGDKSVREVSIWTVDPGKPNAAPVLIDATTRATTKANKARPYDQGFYLPVGALNNQSALIKLRAVAPSPRAKIGLQSAASFAESQQARERLAAGLTGALLALAAFTAVIASFTRNTALAAVSFWIVALFAMTSVALGYDLMWLSYDLPAFIELRVKQMVLGLIIVSTCLMFLCLFRREMAQLQTGLLLKPIFRWLGTGIPIAAIALPVSICVPIFWAISLALLAYFATITARIAKQNRTPTVTIFSASWVSISLCLVAEILYGTGVIDRIAGLSIETGAILGSFLAASAATTSFHYERKRRMRAMFQSRAVARQYRKIYNHVPTGLITLNPENVITQTNPAAREMIDGTELAGTDFSDYVNYQISDHSLTNETRPLRDGTGTVELVWGDKVLNLVSIETDDGMEIAVSDVTARARLQETLEHQASHDHLTGALSWYGLSKSIQTDVEPTLQTGQAWMVLHIMVRNLRAVIKLHGRQAGDVFLQEVSRRIREATSRDGFISRLGNEEFVVMVPTSSRNESIKWAPDLIASVTKKSFSYQAISVNLAIKAGIAFATSQVSAENALLHAQRACDENQSDEFSSIAVFDESGSTNERLRNEKYWDEFLMSSEYTQSLELWAQAITPLNQNGKTCLEILLRIKTADGKLHPPVGVLGAAQRHALLPELDLHIVNATLKYLETQDELRKQLGYVSVNLSGASVNSRSFLRKLTVLLSKYPKAVNCLCIEITESVALIDVPATRAFTEEMRSLGVRLALDDFGSGYTSFAYLQSVPAQVLKMDGTFVRGLENDSKAQSVASGIISLAHSLGMQCVAEWVETQETADRLRELGCDYAQGFLYGKPVPLKQWADDMVQLEAAH